MQTRSRSSANPIKQEPTERSPPACSLNQVADVKAEPQLETKSNVKLRNEIDKLKQENQKATKIILNLTECLNDLKTKVESERERTQTELKGLNDQLRRQRLRIQTDIKKIQSLKSTIRKVTTKKPSKDSATQTNKLKRLLPCSFKMTLNEFYQKNKYPKQTELEEIAKRTNLTTMQINEWFRNRRKRSSEARPRLAISDATREILLDTYKHTKTPSEVQLRKLRKQTGMSSKQLKDWFHNRRKQFNDYSRSRTKYSSEVIEILSEKFKQTKHPTSEELDELARRTGHQASKLKIWFKNKRLLN